MAARTWLVGLAASAFLLAGCGGGASPDPASTPPPASPTAPSTTARPPADGTNVSACADGTCEVEVRAGTRLPVPPGYGLGPVEVAQITPTEVTFRSSLQGGTLDLSARPGSAVTVGSLSAQVERIDGDTAVIALHPV